MDDKISFKMAQELGLIPNPFKEIYSKHPSWRIREAEKEYYDKIQELKKEYCCDKELSLCEIDRIKMKIIKKLSKKNV